MTAIAQRALFPYIGRVGRYGLLERIGGNATSAVYDAFDDAAVRHVALKMIVADLQDERETRERFVREARVTADLVHPNVVQVLEVGDDGGHPFIAMELLAGKPLNEHLAQHQPTLDERVGLMRQLFAGLHVAHAHDVVHRDIKPGNLFVTDQGVLKVLDFGLARLKASTLTATGQVVGTPDFMSPEQAEGLKVDHRSDIFSAAAVCYWIVSGRPPFARGNLRSTLQALLSEAPAPITTPAISDRLMAVITKGLAKAPDSRYQSVAEMLDGLDRACQPQRLGLWRRLTARMTMVPR